MLPNWQLKGSGEITVLHEDGTSDNYKENNLILDNFYSWIISKPSINVLSPSCKLGIGSTLTIPTMGSIETRLALQSGAWPKPTTVVAPNATIIGGDVVAYIEFDFVYAPGQVQGNLAEYGLDFSGTVTATNLLVHTRVTTKDAQGGQAAITVKSTDQLFIKYKLEMKMAVDVPPQLVDVAYDTEVRKHAFVFTWQDLTTFPQYLNVIGLGNAGVYSPRIGTGYVSQIGGSFQRQWGGASSNGAYAVISADETQQLCTYTFDATTANEANGLNLITSGGWYNITITPPIPKVAGQEFTFTLSRPKYRQESMALPVVPEVGTDTVSVGTVWDGVTLPDFTEESVVGNTEVQLYFGVGTTDSSVITKTDNLWEVARGDTIFGFGAKRLAPFDNTTLSIFDEYDLYLDLIHAGVTRRVKFVMSISEIPGLFTAIPALEVSPGMFIANPEASGYYDAISGHAINNGFRNIDSFLVGGAFISSATPGLRSKTWLEAAFFRGGEIDFYGPEVELTFIYRAVPKDPLKETVQLTSLFKVSELGAIVIPPEVTVPEFNGVWQGAVNIGAHENYRVANTTGVQIYLGTELGSLTDVPGSSPSALLSTANSEIELGMHLLTPFDPMVSNLIALYDVTVKLVCAGVTYNGKFIQSYGTSQIALCPVINGAVVLNKPGYPIREMDTTGNSRTYLKTWIGSGAFTGEPDTNQRGFLETICDPDATGMPFDITNAQFTLDIEATSKANPSESVVLSLDVTLAITGELVVTPGRPMPKVADAAVVPLEWKGVTNNLIASARGGITTNSEIQQYLGVTNNNIIGSVAKKGNRYNSTFDGLSFCVARHILNPESKQTVDWTVAYETIFSLKVGETTTHAKLVYVPSLLCYTLQPETSPGVYDPIVTWDHTWGEPWGQAELLIEDETRSYSHLLEILPGVDNLFLAFDITGNYLGVDQANGEMTLTMTTTPVGGVVPLVTEIVVELSPVALPLNSPGYEPIEYFPYPTDTIAVTTPWLGPLPDAYLPEHHVVREAGDLSVYFGIYEEGSPEQTYRSLDTWSLRAATSKVIFGFNLKQDLSAPVMKDILDDYDLFINLTHDGVTKEAKYVNIGGYPVLCGKTSGGEWVGDDNVYGEVYNYHEGVDAEAVMAHAGFIEGSGFGFAEGDVSWISKVFFPPFGAAPYNTNNTGVQFQLKVVEKSTSKVMVQYTADVVVGVIPTVSIPTYPADTATTRDWTGAAMGYDGVTYLTVASDDIAIQSGLYSWGNLPMVGDTWPGILSESTFCFAVDMFGGIDETMDSPFDYYDMYLDLCLNDEVRKVKLVFTDSLVSIQPEILPGVYKNYLPIELYYELTSLDVNWIRMSSFVFTLPLEVDSSLILDAFDPYRHGLIATDGKLKFVLRVVPKDPLKETVQLTCRFEEVEVFSPPS